MFNVVFYQNANGESDVKEYIEKLDKKKDKNSRVLKNKIIAYINKLSEKGSLLGEPFVKHIRNDIWELRPMNDRFLYAHIIKNKIIILSYFVKKTNKTPDKEKVKAENRLKEYLKIKF